MNEALHTVQMVSLRLDVVKPCDLQFYDLFNLIRKLIFVEIDFEINFFVLFENSIEIALSLFDFSEPIHRIVYSPVLQFSNV